MGVGGVMGRHPRAGAAVIVAQIVAGSVVASARLGSSPIPSGWVAYRNGAAHLSLAHPPEWKARVHERTRSGKTLFGALPPKLNVALPGPGRPRFAIRIDASLSTFGRLLRQAGKFSLRRAGFLNGRPYATMTFRPGQPDNLAFALDWGSWGLLTVVMIPGSESDLRRHHPTALRILATLTRLPDPQETWKRHTERSAGYRVAVPPGWTLSRDGGMTRLTSPDRVPMVIRIEITFGDRIIECGSHNRCRGSVSGSIVLDHSADYTEFRDSAAHRFEMRIDWSDGGGSKRIVLLIGETTSDRTWSRRLPEAHSLLRSIAPA